MAATEHMKDLMKRKEEIENEIKELSEVLQSQKNIGMDGPLVDAEGFPRSDIDVYTVRHARHKIACLQTDHTIVMKNIEEELYRIHDEMRQRKMSENVPMETSSCGLSAQETPSFAKIDRVDCNSPAAVGGLEVGDEILEFGSISADNFKSLHQIGEVVKHSIGRPVRVKIQRNNQSLSLSITPGTWSGRGNLGCNIITIKR